MSILYKLWNYMVLGYQGISYYKDYCDTKEHDVAKIEPILETIFRCGPVCIKFCQWMVPHLEIMYIDEHKLYDLNYEKPAWIRMFKKVFEECPEHSLRYTHEEYQRVFHKSLPSEYRILECIGSGSIGQVYKIQHIHTQETYAMKVRHPHIDTDIALFERLYTWFHCLACLYYRVHSVIYLNIPNFIKVFREQSDFVKEANNLLRMTDTYRDNPYLRIPRVIFISESILIMEYVGGTVFEELTDVSEILMSKIFTLLYLFTRDMTLVQNFNHGDLHRSNWKVRPHDNPIGYQVVLYDFGYCWEVSNERQHIIKRAMKMFETYDKCSKEETIQGFSDVMYDAIEHDHIADKDTFRTEIQAFIRKSPLIGESDGYIIVGPVQIYNVVSEFCGTHHLLMTAELIQFVIMYTQVHVTCAKYGYSSIDGVYGEGKIFKERYIHCLNFCKTYNIFPQYCEHMTQTLDTMRPYRGSLFDTIDTRKYASLKSLALS